MARTRGGRGGRAGALLVGGLLSLSACGDPPEAPEAPGRWLNATLSGAGAPSGIAAMGDRLAIVSGGGDRVVRWLDRAALVAGAALVPEALPVEVRRHAPLGGGESFALRGYDLGDLWDQDVDLQGIALAPPDRVWLAERRYRVVYAGRVEVDASGRWTGLRLEHVYSVPGAKRSPTWLDEGAGLAGLAAGVADDVYAIEREGPDAGKARVVRLDRLGVALGRFVVAIGGPEAAVADLVMDGGRFLVLHGAGRGLLAPLLEGAAGREVAAGRGFPGPDVPGAGDWSGIARFDDGGLCLVSTGGRVAWRP
jgi:hypothetical protein